MSFQLHKYVYPDIYIPVNGKLHPDVDEINEEVRTWSFQFKLLQQENGFQQFKREQIVRLTCHCFPDGDYERTVLIAKFMVHVFVLDDTIMERKQGPFFDSLMKHGQSNQNLAKKLDQAIHDTETPVAVAFADFWSEVKKISNEEWQNRFAENYIWYLKANTWEFNNIESHCIPPKADFLEYRRYSSGIFPTFDLIEISLNIFIPISVMANPTFQRLKHITGNVVAFDNDVASFEKERKVGEPNNLVIVLKHELDISYQEAIEIAAEDVSEEVKKFVALEPFLPSFGIEMDKSVKMYVNGLRDWMRGNHDWGFSCGRYPRFAYPKEQF